MTNILLKKSIYMLLVLLIASCSHLTESLEKMPVIMDGRAKISGKITGFVVDRDKPAYVYASITHPISGENIQYKGLIDKSGNFTIDVVLETDISLSGIYTDVNPFKSLLLKLEKDKETKIDIEYDSTYNIKAVVSDSKITSCDMTDGLEIMNKMIDYRTRRAREQLYEKDPDYFLDYASKIVSERLNLFLNRDSCLSKKTKEIVKKDFTMFMYMAHVFDYEGEMKLNYRNTNEDIDENYEFIKIGKPYYRFLRTFNLNDPQNLYTFSFPEFQKKILQNEIINLPEIEESDIPSWLIKVKFILSDLIGFNDGLYYDILVANAYAGQLNERVEPLTEKQKENISSYWKNGEISKILFRKNKEIIELNKHKQPAVVNEISSVPEDKVMETIISKYKNKVIFVDFWATWCAPCLNAMQRFRETKNDFQDKDVVFVYITNTTSPRKLWEEKIKGIGGEHYYMENSQWIYVMDYFGFDAIPSYLLYNKEGIVTNKFVSFPGNNEVKDMINDLL